MRIEHIAMYVNDLEKARDFFTVYLGGHPDNGYHNEKTGFSSYFISFDDGARLEIMNKPGIDSSGNLSERTGFIHVAFSTGSKEKVDSLTALLKKNGYNVISGPRTTGDGYYESCVLDPDGNQVEITA